MSFLLPAIATGVSLLGSLFSGESEQEKEAKRLRQKVQEMKGYSNADISRRGQMIDTAGSARINSTANDIAVTAAGRQNAVLAGTSKLLPQITTLKVDQALSDENYNKQLEVRKTGMLADLDQYSSQDSPMSDFFTAAGTAVNVFNTAAKAQELFGSDTLSGLTGLDTGTPAPVGAEFSGVTPGTISPRLSEDDLKFSMGGKLKVNAFGFIEPKQQNSLFKFNI